MWLLDNYPTIKWHIEIHSYSQIILHCWEDDENQSDDPKTKFAKSEYDRKRGRKRDNYKEYVSKEDHSILTHLTNRIRDGISALNQNEYTVQSVFNLYPTSGSGQDYSHSCHYDSNNKVFGFTIELEKNFILHRKRWNILYEK